MKIFYDMTTKNFSVVEDGTSLYNYFCFVDKNSNRIIFDNLNFGITIKDGKNTVVQESFPKDNIQYVSTDQEVLEMMPSTTLLYNKDYQYHVWVENSGERSEHSFTRKTEKPIQVFPSWSWSDESQRWEPPIPHPDPSKIYLWNEENQEWVLSQNN